MRIVSVASTKVVTQCPLVVECLVRVSPAIVGRGKSDATSNPSSCPTRLNHALNRKQIGGVAQRQAAVFGDVVHGA